MATIGETSMNPPPPESRPVFVRVKRKAHQSRLDAFWLEVNERPTKKAMLDLEKLSICNNSVDVQVEELKAKKVLVKHVETVTSMDTTLEIVQSFVSNSAHVVEEQKRTIKKYSKQEQILSRSRQNQEVLASNARFEQIWRSRRGDRGASEDKALHDMCSFYDVVRVEESFNEVQELEVASLEDQKILSSYLPLLREFLPSAAAELESDIHAYLSNQGSAFNAIPLEDDYVYDYYTVKDDMDTDDIETASPFPLVKVEEEDFYDGLDDESEYDTDDSNAEDHPRNDYPDESSLDDHESESEASIDESKREEEEEESDASSIKHSESDDADNFDDHGSYCDFSDDNHPEFEYGSDDEDWR
ncbi:hypothetical protein OIU85_002983 [Salix viminalis]|uniref:Transcription factor Iwr1 domain-containing protein n=1 Tax=Salix viminalis TaxID=40686 RepID=A0A9Q0T0K3_SALVM|nr:hypothetical protein OIU85_002983 [Salix viminalis]